MKILSLGFVNVLLLASYTLGNEINNESSAYRQLKEKYVQKIKDKPDFFHKIKKFFDKAQGEYTKFVSKGKAHTSKLKIKLKFCFSNILN